MIRLLSFQLRTKFFISSVQRIPTFNLHCSTFRLDENRDKYGNLYEVPEYPFQDIPKNIPRPNEGLDQLRARLVYQCRKRGILETDLILSTFSKKYLKDMSHQDCKDLDKMLDENDWDIYYWSTEERKAPSHIADMPVFKILIEHAKNKDRKILRMPELD